MDACAETARAINATEGREAAAPIAANISVKDDLRHPGDETLRLFGRIGVLVCNAASNPYYGPMSGELALVEHDEFKSRSLRDAPRRAPSLFNFLPRISIYGCRGFKKLQETSISFRESGVFNRLPAE